MVQLCVSAGSLITLRGAGGQPTFEPLPGVVVHVPQKTDPGHGFGVHDVHERTSCAASCRHFRALSRMWTFPQPEGPNDTNAHSLITSLMELQHFGNLRATVLEYHLFHCLSNVDL